MLLQNTVWQRHEHTDICSVNKFIHPSFCFFSPQACIWGRPLFVLVDHAHGHYLRPGFYLRKYGSYTCVWLIKMSAMRESSWFVTLWGFLFCYREELSLSSLYFLTPPLPCMFQFVQVGWRPLVVTMVTATMVCVVQEDVGVTKASEEKPANCVSPATTAPTAQVDQNTQIKLGLISTQTRSRTLCLWDHPFRRKN